MKEKMMDGNMLVQALSSENFSKDEIADAYEMLVTHQKEFLSDDPMGERLRREALKHFKERHSDCKTIEQLAMQADLEYDIDVKNACVLKIDAQKYAEKLLCHQKTKNGGGLQFLPFN